MKTDRRGFLGWIAAAAAAIPALPVLGKMRAGNVAQPVPAPAPDVYASTFTVKGSVAPRPDNGGKTGSRIEGFRQGWAFIPFVGTFGMCHYWRPNRTTPDGIVNGKRVQLWRSLCQVLGGTTEQADAMTGWARCKHCQRQASKLRL